MPWLGEGGLLQHAYERLLIGPVYRGPTGVQIKLASQKGAFWVSNPIKRSPFLFYTYRFQRTILLIWYFILLL